MKRYTPLKRSRKPIPKRSKSPVRAERMRLYAEAREKAKAAAIQRMGRSYTNYDEPFCEYPGCNKSGVDPHHTHGRTGTNLYDVTKIKFLCRHHHNLAHHDPKSARALGLMA